MAHDTEPSGHRLPPVVSPGVLRFSLNGLDSPPAMPPPVLDVSIRTPEVPAFGDPSTYRPVGQPIFSDGLAGTDGLIHEPLFRKRKDFRSFEVPELIIQDSPPWLVSAIVHMVAMILLGIWFFSESAGPYIELDLTYAETLGDQLDEEDLRLGNQDLEALEQIITPPDLIPVDDPLATPDQLEPSVLPLNLTSNTPSDLLGMALTGREKGTKESLLAAYGGNATTQAAVLEGLKWLARNQGRGGLWSLSGPYSDGVPGTRNEQAATGMALLAFQGNGHTHKGDSDDPYTQVVARAWSALLKRQEENGAFFQPDELGRTQLYTHAICTIALCELYAMTHDEAFREPAERAIEYCVQAQSPQGGWRYEPQEPGDMSVTGWFVMALKSAQMAGLEVPSTTLSLVDTFLDEMARENGSRYVYQSSRQPTVVMTAEGLLCRQYLGWAREDPRLVAGVEFILENQINYSDMDVYYWYYATQVCHHMEGVAWRQWNEVMRQEVPAHQVRQGRERGSWEPAEDRWAFQGGGRLYVTCLSIYMLEVYYRHLPLYRQELILGL
ncbi:MAG: terpene cyclase/mutase family protein [Pirellulales bacterium]|nr:terpene cyclase/mutase family protein [Pirellulales bacterium]